MADLDLTDKYTHLNAPAKGVNGALPINGLASNFVRHGTATTYNTTDVYGLTILVPGTGTLTLSPKDGGTDVVLTSAEVIALGAGYTLYTHCDEIALSNADMEVLIYTG